MWWWEDIWREKEDNGGKEKNEKWIENGIRDEGAETISESLRINTSLTHLDLGCDEMKKREEKKNENEKWIDNEIGDKGAKAISESLRINTSLTELHLEGDEKIIEESEKGKE